MSKSSLLTENLKSLEGFRPEVDVVADLPYKDEYMSNSFFAIGHFDVEGRTLDYLYHIMSYAFPGKEPEITYCLSVTDETAREYVQHSHAYPMSECEMGTDKYLVRTPTGAMEGDLGHMRLTAQTDEAALDLELTSVGYPLYNGGTGKFHMVGMDIFEYSIPTMLTNGVIRMGDKTYRIEDGVTWYDRQWQNKLPKGPEFVMRGVSKMMDAKAQRSGEGFTLPVWGWMDINLDCGDKISTWFAIEDGRENCWATVMHPDGAQRTVRVDDVVKSAGDYWTSEASGASYPMTYKISIPELEADLTVRCAVEDQELYFPEKALYNHYEGASTVEGTYEGSPACGYCYTELIGDWSK